MSTRPLVAVIGRRSPQVSALRFAGLVVAEAVVEAVFRAGGEPVVVNGHGDTTPSTAARRLAPFAGVLLPGGGDLGAATYGEPPHAATEPPDHDQDSFELAVAGALVRGGQPALAICRGMQVLNVACGGSLDQHLAGQETHRNALHEVTVDPGSRLAAVLGDTSVKVSSYHHQAIARLGEGLRVLARADDGVIEAVEHVRAEILAVQWHPEDLAATHPPDQQLFDDLVERARSRTENRS